jgi:hypothetical protein
MGPASLVSCIDPDLLEKLNCLEEVESCEDVDKVTDSSLEAWMKKSLGEVAKLTTTKLPPWFYARSEPTCRRKTVV